MGDRGDPLCSHARCGIVTSGGPEGLMASLYDRQVLVETLIRHQRIDRPPYVGGCACGWGQRPEHLGLSWAEHVADVYELAVANLEGTS